MVTEQSSPPRPLSDDAKGDDEDAPFPFMDKKDDKVPNKDEDEEEEEASASWSCCGRGVTNEEEGNEIFHLQRRAKVSPMV